ncbi:MAG: hypothetical protein JWQ73_3155 [Variovorax sp.]|jgi:hypothetical protein|nr:hypothetical protein [Variovorax sp.]
MDFALHFVSLDGNIYATCLAPAPGPASFKHAAILTSDDLTVADAAMKKFLAWQHWPGDFTQYAGEGEAQHRLEMARGSCKVYAFASAEDRDAFCRWTHAARGHFLKVVVQGH